MSFLKAAKMQEMAGILQHSRHALAQFQQQAIGENHSQEKN